MLSPLAGGCASEATAAGRTEGATPPVRDCSSPKNADSSVFPGRGSISDATVTAGDLVEISTSCLVGKHDVCGNEETFYPPLTKVDGAYPVFTDVASFQGKGLNCTWQIAGTRSAFLAAFFAESAPGKGAGAEVALAR